MNDIKWPRNIDYGCGVSEPRYLKAEKRTTYQSHKNTSKTKRANELARPFCSQIHRHRGNMRLHGIFPGIDICGSIAELGVSIDGGYPKMDGL